MYYINYNIYLYMSFFIGIATIISSNTELQQWWWKMKICRNSLLSNLYSGRISILLIKVTFRGRGYNRTMKILKFPSRCTMIWRWGWRIQQKWNIETWGCGPKKKWAKIYMWKLKTGKEKDKRIANMVIWYSLAKVLVLHLNYHFLVIMWA